MAMKPSTCTDCRTLGPKSRIPGFVRGLAFACLTLLPSVIAVPTARAAGADGIYQFTSVSGSFVLNGDKVKVPKDVLKQAFFKNGRLVITNNEMPIYRSRLVDLMGEINYMGLTGTLNIKGPSKLALSPAGNSYIGSTARPVVLTLTGAYMGTPFVMIMRMDFDANVTGNTLTVTAPVTVSILGVEMDGWVNMIATR